MAKEQTRSGEKRPAHIEVRPAGRSPGWLVEEIREVRARTREGSLPVLAIRKHQRSFRDIAVVIPVDFVANLIRGDRGEGGSS